MKVQELLISMKHPNFNMEKELQVKTYLPIEEKKLIAQGIIFECTEEEDGVIKLDSMQQYLSYVKYMITRHTNLEYTDSDYDTLCEKEYEDGNLLNAILSFFTADAQECSRILNLMLDDHMRNNSMEISIGKFLNKIGGMLENLSGSLGEKVKELDVKSILPENLDIEKLNGFLNTYVK